MNPVAKIAITGANMAAAALTSKGLGAAWKRVTGNEPPTMARVRRHSAQCYCVDRHHLRSGCPGKRRHRPRTAPFLLIISRCNLGGCAAPAAFTLQRCAHPFRCAE